MPKITPTQAADEWANRLSGSTEKMKRGIEAVQSSPMEKAANSKEKMLRNLTEAVNNGKWERGLRSVSLSDWKAATIAKGIPRVSQGAMAAKPKMQSFFTRLFPYQESLQAQIADMPDLTIEDSIQRATAWMRGMHNFDNNG